MVATQTTQKISVGQRIFGLHILLLLALGAAVGFASKFFAGASAGEFDAHAINSGDTAWVLTASALVMIMTPAVGFFYGGMVRSKNVVSVIKQSLVILALVSLQWVLFGYSLAFGKDIGGGLLGGLGFFGLNGVGYAPNPDYAPTIPHLAYMIFQAMLPLSRQLLSLGHSLNAFAFALWSSLSSYGLPWSTILLLTGSGILMGGSTSSVHSISRGEPSSTPVLDLPR